MSSETQQGFVLYFDALSALSRQVDCGQISAEDAFSVVTALGQYAQTGEEPEAGSLSPVASMAYAMMIVGVKKSLAKYAEKAKKSRRAAHARWESDASHSMQEMQADAAASQDMQEMQTHADACERMPSHESDASIEHEHETEIEVVEEEREQEENAPAADGFGEQIRKHQAAMRLIETYRLPDVPTTLDAVLEDIDRFGEKALDRALREACNANSRDRLSVNFYRSVLSRMTGGPSSRGAPRAAPAFEQKGGKEFFDGFEVYE